MEYKNTVPIMSENELKAVLILVLMEYKNTPKWNKRYPFAVS